MLNSEQNVQPTSVSGNSTKPNVSSSKELLIQELNKEREWMSNDKTPFCYGETLEQEKHIDRIIELERLLKLMDEQ